MNKYIFLSQNFYTSYPNTDYPEIECKIDRPYIQIIVEINGTIFAVPLRSNINHPFVLWTDRANKCGVDFSKTVVVNNPNFIDTQRKPHIRQNEFDALRGKEYKIRQKLLKYIEDYKQAKADLENEYNLKLYNYSTLKYFEEYL